MADRVPWNVNKKEVVVCERCLAVVADRDDFECLCLPYGDMIDDDTCGTFKCCGYGGCG